MIPLFVISFNRGAYLKPVIESYKAQDLEIEVVIHDNGSSEPDTLRVLSELSSAGLKVYRHGPITTPEELNHVDDSVQRYARQTGYDGPYAVTDCDIDFSDTHPHALRTYIEILELCEDAECAGPMLRIADIPRSYPLFNRVMARHIAQFWGRQPEWLEVHAGRVACLRHRIDTTFAVHRAGSSFRRLKPGVRVYHPFEAKHLDWYVSNEGRTNYRATSSPAVSHWDNEIEFSKYQPSPEHVLSYTVVEGELGDLRTIVRSTLDNPS